MSSLIQTLASYVPELVIQRLAARSVSLHGPTRETFPAVVLFADISGFMPLTLRFAQRGPEGVEELSCLLNAFFGTLLDSIDEHGGDVISFAGDALTTLWQEADLERAALRAARCALAIQDQLREQRLPHREQISLRIAISAGAMNISLVGGADGRWFVLPGGVPLYEACQIQRQILPGEVILAPEAAALLESSCEGDWLPVGGLRLKALRVAPTPSAERPPDLRPEDELAGQGLSCAIGIATGRVFCGTIGNQGRRHYGLIGESLSLAARLMQAAGAPDAEYQPSILCDGATYAASYRSIQFEPLPPLLVKGQNAPVAIYYPVRLRQQAEQSPSTMLQPADLARRQHYDAT